MLLRNVNDNHICIYDINKYKMINITEREKLFHEKQ